MSADTVFWMSLLEKLKLKKQSWFPDEYPHVYPRPRPPVPHPITLRNPDFPEVSKDYSGVLLFDSNTWIEEHQYLPPQLSFKSSEEADVTREAFILKSCVPLPVDEAVFRQTCPVLQHQPRIEVRNITIPACSTPLEPSMLPSTLVEPSMLEHPIIPVLIFLMFLLWQFIRSQFSAGSQSADKPISGYAQAELSCMAKLDEVDELVGSVTQALAPYQTTAGEPLKATAATIRIRIGLLTFSRAMFKVVQAENQALFAQLGKEKALTNIYHKLYQCFRHRSQGLAAQLKQEKRVSDTYHRMYRCTRQAYEQLQMRIPGLQARVRTLEAKDRSQVGLGTFLRAMLQVVQAKKQALEVQLQQEKVVSSIYRKSYQCFQNGYMQLRIENSELKPRMKTLEAEKQLAEQKNEELEQKLAKQGLEADAKGEKTTLNAEMDQFQSMKEELEHKLTKQQLEAEDIKQQNKRLNTEKGRLQESLNTSRIETVQFKKTADDCQQKLIDNDHNWEAMFEADRKTRNNEKTQLKKDLAISEAERPQLTRALETSEAETQSLKKKVRAQEDELFEKAYDVATNEEEVRATLNSEIAQLKKELDASEIEIRRLKETNQDLHEFVEQLEGAQSAKTSAEPIPTVEETVDEANMTRPTEKEADKVNEASTSEEKVAKRNETSRTEEKVDETNKDVNAHHNEVEEQEVSEAGEQKASKEVEEADVRPHIFSAPTMRPTINNVGGTDDLRLSRFATPAVGAQPVTAAAPATTTTPQGPRQRQPAMQQDLGTSNWANAPNVPAPRGNKNNKRKVRHPI